MSRTRSLFLGTLISVGIAGLATDARACPTADRVEPAVAAEDVGTLQQLHANMAGDPACPSALTADLARRLAVLLTRRGETAALASDIDGDGEQDWLEALHYDEYWKALLRLGDLAHDQRNYAVAQGYYERSLVAIDAIPAGQPGPDTDLVARIFNKAQSARLLSATYASSPPGRNGRPGGIADTSIRGFVPKVVAVPIRFATDSTLIVGDDLRAAEDLLRIVTQEARPRITLAGHADERGDAAYNKQLSLRRVETVAAFLKSHGYTGDIIVMGFGEDRPFEPDQPRASYSDEERWRLDRRVELVRDNQGPG